MKLEKLNIIDFLKNDSILLKIVGNKIIIEIVSLTSNITGSEKELLKWFCNKCPDNIILKADLMCTNCDLYTETVDKATKP